MGARRGMVTFKGLPTSPLVALFTKPSCLKAHHQIERIRNNILECNAQTTFTSDNVKSKRRPDLVVTYGGDGTLLAAASKYPGKAPPFLPISGGTLGAMLPFNGVVDAENIIQSIFKCEPVPVMQRMRLQVRIVPVNGGKAMTIVVLNEVNVHRGSSPHLARFECSLDDMPFTSVASDGLLIASPTGSTAYSMSAGGSLVHPLVSGIVMTPICPRSLSFRPVILPDTTTVSLIISTQNRAPLVLSLDGQRTIDLPLGSKVYIKKSLNPLPVICSQSIMQDWISTVNNRLRFNTPFDDRLSLQDDEYSK